MSAHQCHCILLYKYKESLLVLVLVLVICIPLLCSSASATRVVEIDLCRVLCSDHVNGRTLICIAILDVYCIIPLLPFLKGHLRPLKYLAGWYTASHLRAMYRSRPRNDVKCEPSFIRMQTYWDSFPHRLRCGRSSKKLIRRRRTKLSRATE